MSRAAGVELEAAFRDGDLGRLRAALGDPADFPNCPPPTGFGDSLLEYAIYHGPLALIRALLEEGADANYPSAGGFPSLIAALACAERADRGALIELLLAHGADVAQRGINDYTPLHYAASNDDVAGLELLLAHGADPRARTRIDDRATPLEEAELLGKREAARLLRDRAGRG